MKSIIILFLILFSLGSSLAIITSYLKTNTTISSDEKQKFIDANNIWSLGNYNSQSRKQYNISVSLSSEKALPTNKWFTGSLDSSNPKPIYPLPHALIFEDSLIGYSIPEKSIEKSAINQVFNQDFSLTFGIKYRYELSYWDALVAKYSLIDLNNDSFGEVTVVRGNPLIYLSLNNKDIFINNTSSIELQNNESLVFVSNSKKFYLYKDNTEVIQVSNDSMLISKTKSTTNIAIGFIDSIDLMDKFDNFAKNRVVDSEVKYKTIGTTTSVTYKINTVNNEATIFGLLPHQYSNYINKSVFKLNTIRGDMQFFIGNEFKIEQQLAKIESQFDMSHLTDGDLTKLDEYLSTDKKELKIKSTSIYFIGKDLFRLSNMLDIAKYLDGKLGGDRSSEIASVITNELADWFEYTKGEQNKYFAYDDIRKGLIALKPDFGSENFNDHHFHYGYFIYAFATISKYDKIFYENYADIVDLLVKDIANDDMKDSNFPYFRYFDFYEWHSWANGTDKFTEGNNQESVSEAINAWYAIYLLGVAIGNDEYKATGELLYNLEVESAKHYWWNYFDNESIFPQGYDYPIASLIWGGKLESKTFFSNDPNAKLGIIMLPFSVGSKYLIDKKTADRILKYNKQDNGMLFQDMLDMYFMMNKLPYNSDILKWKLDSTNSYSYTLLSKIVYSFKLN